MDSHMLLLSIFIHSLALAAVVPAYSFLLSAVSLMLRQTLKRQKFLSLMCCRPLAVEHLVNYLTIRHELSAVTNLLVALGRFHES